MAALPAARELQCEQMLTANCACGSSQWSSTIAVQGESMPSAKAEAGQKTLPQILGLP